MQATLTQLVAAIAGATVVPAAAPDIVIGVVSLDSRNVPPGALFVALRGDTFDGHDFLAQVAQAGAGAVVVEALPAGWAQCSNGVVAIVVPDTLVALGQIASFWRCQHALPVIGVAGSNGKTTVKEMIASILRAALGEDGYLATRGNFNNQIGVPLTLMRLEPAHGAAVIELGMNHPGEIARLSAIAQPTLALVNNAQREHQEFMHSVRAVALENGAVLAGLPPDGVAVFPFDDEFTALWRDLAGARRTLTFAAAKAGVGRGGAGDTSGADVSCTWRINDFGSDLFVTIRTAAAPLQFFVDLAAAGEHNVRNALAACACAFGIGIGCDAIKRGLQAFTPVNGRLQRKMTASGITVIDDSYNANPDSVRAAIDVLAQAAPPRILVLGDMGEVGTLGRQFHEEIGAYAASCGIEHLLATGELARHLNGDHGRVTHFEQFDALVSALDELLAASTDSVNDAGSIGNTRATVLVKGSRFMQMERIVCHLVDPQDSQNLQKNNKEVH